MSERDWRLFLKDIRDCAARVIDYVGIMSREEFFRDSKTVDAVMRNLAIIGEAAKKIPADARRKYPSVEWKKMAGLRDIVVHDYFGIDEDIIWDVVSVRTAHTWSPPTTSWNSTRGSISPNWSMAAAESLKLKGETEGTRHTPT